MARALIVAALMAVGMLSATSSSSSLVTGAEARVSLWGKGRDKVNRNTAGASDYITSLQKLKHLAIEHHSLVPPHIRTATGAFNLFHDNKIFHDTSDDRGVTSLFTEDLPYWSFVGAAVASDDYIRLTPNRQSQQGGLWNLEPLDLPSFELRVGVRIHSKANVGADGMGIWIVDELPGSFGPTFGLPTKFHGLGILVDTYDNDANRDNPVISLIYSSENDKLNGGRRFNVGNDYKDDVLGRCTVDFRNQADPTVLVLRYHAPLASSQHDEGKVELSVIRTSGPKGEIETETPCASITARQAPLALGDRGKKYWLGATAETGGMSDNHDIVFMAVMPLAGVAYDRDVHDLSDEAKEVREEEVNGERMHRYVNRKDKEERSYWKAKTPEEEEAERKAKAQEYLDQLHREAAEKKAERQRQFELERQQEEEAARQQQAAQQQQQDSHHPPRHDLHNQHNQQQQQQNQQQNPHQYQQQQQHQQKHQYQQQVPQQQQYQQQQQIPQQQQQQQIPQQQQYQQPPQQNYNSNDGQQQQYQNNQQQQYQQQAPQQQIPQNYNGNDGQRQQYQNNQQQQYQQQIPQQQQYQQQVPQQQQQVPQQQQQYQ